MCHSTGITDNVAAYINVHTIHTVVRVLAAKARGPGFDSQQLPGCFLFQQAF